MSSVLSARGQAWLQDVCIWGKLIPESQSHRKSNFPGERYNLMYGFTGANAEGGREAAEAVCSMIKARTFDQHKLLDQQLVVLEAFGFNPDGNSCENKQAKTSAIEMALWIAQFCKQAGLSWNDTIHSNEEIEEFKKTYLGLAVTETHNFVSERQAAANAGVAHAPAQKQASATNPQANYKTSGPQSKNARDLISKPGKKEYPALPGAKMIGLEFDKKGANVPNLFINPLLQTRKFTANNTNAVIAGSGNGWSDCQCYFADTSEADAFLKAYVEKNKLNPVLLATGETVWDSPTYTGLRARSCRADGGGYFRINTECGECYIKARKLNEDIEEETDGVLTEATIEDEFPNAKEYAFDFNKFAEAYYRYDK